MDIIELSKNANAARKNMFEAFYRVGNGHYGGCLSEIEILTQIYFAEMQNIDPEEAQKKDRDRFVLSKGHGGYGLYAVLAQRGFLDPKRMHLFEDGVMLPKHADKHRVPGVDISTGSLGQGLSVAVGMAIAAKRFQPGVRVYAVLGDGECNEGCIWEAAMAASKYRLDNLIGVIDKNVFQFDGTTQDVMPMEPFIQKWEAFGWHAINVNDGHNFEQLGKAFAEAKATEDRPSVIIANTIKGKGISFMEGVRAWHGGVCSEKEFEQGMKELEKEGAAI